MKLALKKKNIPELVIVIICALFMVWGLIYLIFGLLARFLPVADANNQFKLFDNAIHRMYGLGTLGWGLILFGVFGVILAITLVVFAKGVDKEFEKSQRRSARLSRQNDKPAPNVVEAEVK